MEVIAIGSEIRTSASVVLSAHMPGYHASWRVWRVPSRNSCNVGNLFGSRVVGDLVRVSAIFVWCPSSLTMLPAQILRCPSTRGTVHSEARPVMM